MRAAMTPEIQAKPVTGELWPDLVRLFGEHGAYSGCWCMWWRVSRRQFGINGNAGNRQAMERLIQDGVVPGLLGYVGDEPVVWCSVGPRSHFPSLNRSPALKPVDDEPVWAIVCFYMRPAWRGQGLMGRMIEAAASYARENGACCLEAFPIDMQGPLKGCEGYMGLLPAFQKAGFREVARRRPHQPVMRLQLG